MSEINDRLRELIPALGLKSQSKLAMKVGVSRQFMSDVLKGKSRVGEQILSGLADIGVNTNWLLTGKGAMMADGSEPRHASGSKRLEEPADAGQMGILVDQIGRMQKEIDRVKASQRDLFGGDQDLADAWGGLVSERKEFLRRLIMANQREQDEEENDVEKIPAG